MPIFIVFLKVLAVGSIKIIFIGLGGLLMPVFTFRTTSHGTAPITMDGIVFLAEEGLLPRADAEAGIKAIERLLHIAKKNEENLTRKQARKLLIKMEKKIAMEIVTGTVDLIIWMFVKVPLKIYRWDYKQSFVTAKIATKKAIFNWTTVWITVLYVVVGYFLIRYWDQVVMVWDMSGGFLLTVLTTILHFFSELNHGTIMGAIVILSGLVVPFVQLVVAWLLYSLKGGIARLYTIAPARAFLLWLHRENVWVQRVVQRLLTFFEKGWEKSKKAYLRLGWFHRVYLAIAAVPAGFFLLVGFVLAKALRLVLANKAGEILIEKVLLWVGKHIPLTHYVIDPVQKRLSRMLAWAQKTSQRFRKEVEDAKEKTA